MLCKCSWFVPDLALRFMDYLNPSFIVHVLLLILTLFFFLVSRALGSQGDYCVEISSSGQLDLLLVGNVSLALVYDGQLKVCSSE